MKPVGSTQPHDLPDSLAHAIESARVPALPQVLLKLLQLTDDDAATMAEMAAVVERDPGLCTRLLTAANSPGLRRGRELRSVAHCLASLGTRLIRSIATCLALQSMFDRRYDAVRPDLTDYWRHSIRVAETARELASACAYPQPDEAYLGGLLHDIGELVLLSAHGTNYAQLLSTAADEDGLVALENEHLGAHHGEVGAWLVDRWQFDLDIADGILFHHTEVERIATADRLPQLIWLAHAASLASPDDAGVKQLAERLFGASIAGEIGAIGRRSVERTEQVADAIGVGPDPGKNGAPISVLPKVAVSAVRPSEGKGHEDIDQFVRDLALMQPLQRDLFGVDNDVELLYSLRESARILFDLGHIAVFLRNADDDRLSAARFGEQAPLLRRATLRIDAPNCLVARAAGERQIVSSFDENYAQPAALIDVQFARVFGTEGLLCVPLNGRSSCIGVLVFGLSSAQYGRLQKRFPWVLNFGRIAALSIEVWHEAIRRRERADAEASAHFERQARRVIHEAGNPLGIIRSYLQILDGKLPKDSDAHEEIGILKDEIDRVSSIVQRLSEFPSSTGQARIDDLAGLVREFLGLYDEPLFRSRGIEVSLRSGDSSMAVEVDRNSLKQVLLNLWKNAAEAMATGGRLEVVVDGPVMQNGRRYLSVTIADTGPGISEAALATMQSVAAGGSQTGSGRGHGLPIVGSLVEALGATLNCRSRPGAGTTFELFLPCAD